MQKRTNLAHGGDEDQVLVFLPVQILAAIVHAALLDQQFEQSDGLLGAVAVHLRHVQIVDEDDEFLAGRWTEGVLGAFLHVRFQVALHVSRRCSRGEVDVQLQLNETVRVSASLCYRSAYVGVRVQFAQERGDRRRLRGTRLPDEEHWAFDAVAHLQQPVASASVDGGD